MRQRAPLFAALLLASCGGGQPAGHATASAAEARDVPSWCASVDAALGRAGAARGFRCLPVPNYLVTGFYGTATNPERSDFLNGCFAGQSESGERLRMNVRPAGDIDLAFGAERNVQSGARLDLSFLGPWAPKLEGRLGSSSELQVKVTLRDAEIRVLPSVPEILGQAYAAAESEPERREALERCISSLCEANAKEPLVYTAKVFAAVPVVSVNSSAGQSSVAGVELAAGGGFERAETRRDRRSLVLQAREKLNVAALLEPARAAFERAGTCQLVQKERTRREVTRRLRELALRTLAGRDLREVETATKALRKELDAPGAFSTHEQGDLLAALEALELASHELSAARPTTAGCAAVELFGRVLTGTGKDNRIHDTLLEVAQPLHRRLLDLANSHSLPCAEPAWFQDADGDGYGTETVRLRRAAQPAGFVANSLDCFDRNAEARPGQQKHFARHRGDGSFDYDCDGKESIQKDLLAGGCKSITRFTIPIRCWAQAGWQGKAPGCGDTGRWLSDCAVSTFSCDMPDERLERQACR
ncbi:MAG TPA: hypothetical protein VK524_33920 [Polyangiaceae bacterium]|nr:hypothetical protein [Polyangiaceae bacterium]